MSAHIDECIDGYDLEGNGDSLDEALENMAKQCDDTADQQATLAERLREAARHYRALREVKR